MRRLFLVVPMLCTALFLGQVTMTHASGYNVATTSCRYIDSYGDVTVANITFDYSGTSVYRDQYSGDASFTPASGRAIIGGGTDYSGNGSYLTAEVTGLYMKVDGTQQYPIDYYINMYPSGAYSCG